jgi:hypothetical protein
MIVDVVILVAFFVTLLLYRIVEYFSSFGFSEYFAKNFGPENRPGLNALFL